MHLLFFFLNKIQILELYVREGGVKRSGFRMCSAVCGQSLLVETHTEGVSN